MLAPTSLQDLRRRQVEEARQPRPPSRPPTAPLPLDLNSRPGSLSEQLMLKRTSSQLGMQLEDSNSITFPPSAFSVSASATSVSAPLPKRFQTIKPTFAQDVRADSFADVASRSAGTNAAAPTTDFSSLSAHLTNANDVSKSLASSLSNSLQSALNGSKVTAGTDILSRSLSYRVTGAPIVKVNIEDSMPALDVKPAGVQCGVPVGEYPTAPLDWALKSRMRFFAAIPFDSLTEPISSLARRPFCAAEPNRDSDIVGKFAKALTYYMYPPDATQYFAGTASTPAPVSRAITVSTSTTTSVANTASVVSAAAAPFVLSPALAQLATIAANKVAGSRSDLEQFAAALIEQRWLAFDEALVSLHSSFRAGTTPVYYMHWHRLAIVVRQMPVRTSSGTVQWPCAMLSGVDARLRTTLLTAGVGLHAPFAAVSQQKVAAPQSTAWDPDRAAEFTIATGHALTMDALASRVARDTHGAPHLVLESRIREVTEREREDASLLLCVGALSVQQLLDTLRAVLRSSQSNLASADEPPVLLSRTPFLHSGAEMLRMQTFAPANLAAGSTDTVHSFEIVGPLLPDVQRDLQVAISAWAAQRKRSNDEFTGAVRMHAMLPPDPTAAPGLNLLDAFARVSVQAQCDASKGASDDEMCLYPAISAAAESKSAVDARVSLASNRSALSNMSVRRATLHADGTYIVNG